MPKRAESAVRRREITTTPYFDDQVTALAQKLGVSRSEAYRHIQRRADGDEQTRQIIRHHATAARRDALALQQEAGDRHAYRTGAILRALGEILALL